MSLLLENIKAFKVCKALIDNEISNGLASSNNRLPTNRFRVDYYNHYDVTPYFEDGIKTRVVEVDNDIVYFGIDINSIRFTILNFEYGSPDKYEGSIKDSLVVNGGSALTKYFNIPTRKLKYIPILMFKHEGPPIGYRVSTPDFDFTTLIKGDTIEVFQDFLTNKSEGLYSMITFNYLLNSTAPIWKHFSYKLTIQDKSCSGKFGG